MRCAVLNCGSCSTNNGISFFPLPSDEALLKKWLSFCQIDNFNSKTAYVCMKHFNVDDFETSFRYGMGYTNKMALKLGTVPTIVTDAKKVERKPIVDKRKNGCKCIIESCQRSYRDATESLPVRLFQFPKNDPFRRIWIEKCNLMNTCMDNAHICDYHFETQCFGKKRLQKDAVPSLHLDAADNNKNIRCNPTQISTVDNCALPSRTTTYSGEDRFEKQCLGKKHLTKTAISSLQLNESEKNKNIQNHPINFEEQTSTVKNCALLSRTCGLIEVTMDKTFYTLNCIHCAEKFSINHWKSFLVHMNEKHNGFKQDINNDKLQNDNTIVNKENGILVITSTDTQDKILLQQESKISKDITLPKLNYYDKVKEKNVNQEHNTPNGSGKGDSNGFNCSNDCNDDQQQNTDFCSSVKENVNLETCDPSLNKFLLDCATEDSSFESSYNNEFVSESSETGQKMIKDDISVLGVADHMQVNEEISMEFDDTNIKMEEFIDL